ncbi:MAG: TIGR02099 family protein, partial [Rhizobiales bacterium]|nr:TIGR02099 family protein [Rhizobacter sp.]
PGPRRAVMDFKLQLTDSGALLDRLGTPGVVRGGKGQLSGQIGWVGSPFALDYPTLAGQINVAIDAGQFLKVEPGAARLLGVLSLQSLPRRLSLDFRDLFQEGFAFDTITGDLKIGQGVAVTNNLRMRGVQALVLMEGNADIERETQDLRVVVVPEISAATAALAYAVINPAIGLGALLAQAILKKPLTEANTREFQVSGPWADPKVERVERKVSEGSTAKE